MSKIAKTTETLMDMYIEIKDSPYSTQEKEEALQMAINVMLLLKGSFMPIATLFELCKDGDRAQMCIL